MPHIASIQVGLPQTYDAESETRWTSAIVKHSVSGAVQVGRENIEGDGQANLSVHGGVDKAILAYSADHYSAWRQELEIDPFPHGAFGENLTIAGLTESNVCLGDVWQAGSVRLEVSQPRQPCWKLGRRWENKLLPKLVVKSGRSGWYFRVLETGSIEAPMDFVLVERRHAAWTITRANNAMYQETPAVDLMELVSLPELSAAWIKSLPA